MPMQPGTLARAARAVRTALRLRMPVGCMPVGLEPAGLVQGTAVCRPHQTHSTLSLLAPASPTAPER